MKKRLLLGTAIIAAFAFGTGTADLTKKVLVKTNQKWDDTISKQWGSEFQQVEIKSSHADAPQRAYFFPAEEKMPLIVSLHTWSGDYSQQDPLSALAKKAGWNYIHPDFQGPNNNPSACLGPAVTQDIDDSIRFAIAHGKVDTSNVFVVGVSGGAHAALGYYMKGALPVKATLAWVPITDMATWQIQSEKRHNPYARDIAGCLSAATDSLAAEAARRSPLMMDAPDKAEIVEIYAGIRDGYTGSVPTSHSINMFNKLASAFGHEAAVVTATEAVGILTLGAVPDLDKGQIEQRDVYLDRTAGQARLVVFEGGHEMLPDYTFQRLQTLASSTR